MKNNASSDNTDRIKDKINEKEEKLSDNNFGNNNSNKCNKDTRFISKGT